MTYRAGNQGGTDIFKGLNRETGVPLPQLFSGREERCERDTQIKLPRFLETETEITHSLEESHAISLNFQAWSFKAPMLDPVYPPDGISFLLISPQGTEAP